MIGLPPGPELVAEQASATKTPAPVEVPEVPGQVVVDGCYQCAAPKHCLQQTLAGVALASPDQVVEVGA
jgi:hypothetical protein